MQPPSLSLVVPVYNSQPTLRELVARLTFMASSDRECFEIVLVNDGSSDGSWEEIVTIAAEHDHVRGIDLMRNFGQHNAVLAGVRAAKYDVVVTLDDDLQHPPEEIPALLAALDGDDACDLVYGTPTRLRHSRLRNVSTAVSKVMLERLTGWPDVTSVTDFRAFRTRLREGFADYKGPTIVFDALLAWTTTSIKHVRVEHAPRAVGRSNYRLTSLLAYGVTMMTVFSARPLRLIGVLGGLCSAVGVVAVAAVLIHNATTGANLSSVGLALAVIVTFAGAQLFAIGVAGEYIAYSQRRLLDETTYLVRRITPEPSQGLGKP
jgi:hypothetical protein